MQARNGRVTGRVGGRSIDASRLIGTQDEGLKGERPCKAGQGRSGNASFLKRERPGRNRQGTVDGRNAV